MPPRGAPARAPGRFPTVTLGAGLPAISWGMTRKNLLLTAFLITPFLGLVAIFWAVAYDSRADRRTEMDRAPRIGAGANETGGANAIGELMAGNRATGPERPSAAPPATGAGAPPVDGADAGLNPPTQPGLIDAPAPGRPGEFTGDVRAIRVTGGGGTPADLQRDLRVWLPPGYFDPANGARRYPVLFLMDGQNLFSYSPPAGGDWQADETVSRLVEAKQIADLIIVGVPHAERLRITEYAPHPFLKDVPAAGAEFESWFMGTVLPRVREVLRVSREPGKTGIGGSSLGAAISLRLASRHPDVFGRVLIESLSDLPEAGEPWEKEVRDAALPGARVWIGVGGAELGPQAHDRNAAFAAFSTALAESLRASGDPGRVHLELEPDAPHHESAWARRLEPALKFLFPREP